MDYTKEEEFEEESSAGNWCCLLCFPWRTIGETGASKALFNEEDVAEKTWARTMAARGGNALRRLEQKLKKGRRWRRGEKAVFRYDMEDYALNFESEDCLDEILYYTCRVGSGRRAGCD